MPGVTLTDHLFSVPLDHDRTDGEHLEIYARDVVAAGRELLFARGDWPDLYDSRRLAANDVPVAAAVYLDDMYVDATYSLQTAKTIRGLRRPASTSTTGFAPAAGASSTTCWVCCTATSEAGAGAPRARPYRNGVLIP